VGLRLGICFILKTPKTTYPSLRRIFFPGGFQAAFWLFGGHELV
jgi:hypothetical protein